MPSPVTPDKCAISATLAPRPVTPSASGSITPCLSPLVLNLLEPDPVVRDVPGKGHDNYRVLS